MKHEELVAYLKAARPQVDDQTAAICKDFYPEWDSFNEGHSFAVGDRVNCDDVLWKCIGAHAKQANWRPSIYTASIWTAINAEHAGTIEDPIPVPEQLTSFEYEWGKYYSESGTLYICDRQGGKDGDTYTLAYKPSALVGHYFSVVE